jgi:hypothetical protein
LSFDVDCLSTVITSTELDLRPCFLPKVIHYILLECQGRRNCRK